MATSANISRRSKDYSIVTARVPADIRRKGNDILKELGATPTELINAAYSYVISNERLPETKNALAVGKTSKRDLSQEQVDAILERRKRTTFAVPETFWEGKSDKELVEAARKAKYEALA